MWLYSYIRWWLNLYFFFGTFLNFFWAPPLSLFFNLWGGRIKITFNVDIFYLVWLMLLHKMWLNSFFPPKNKIKSVDKKGKVHFQFIIPLALFYYRKINNAFNKLNKSIKELQVSIIFIYFILNIQKIKCQRKKKKYIYKNFHTLLLNDSRWLFNHSPSFILSVDGYFFLFVFITTA